LNRENYQHSVAAKVGCWYRLTTWPVGVW